MQGLKDLLFRELFNVPELLILLNLKLIDWSLEINGKGPS